mmetsp:Transcript_14268/g.31283  ORF Transcript_14268/g.31283 Transcript_14268/m.31283 type:complete len:554 (+) Transcript_14268:117-1778(+)
MEEVIVGIGPTFFGLDSDHDTVGSHADDDDDELFDFELPSQFLIPMRDRAFSWDISFEDHEIQAESSGAKTNKIVIKATTKGTSVKVKAESADKKSKSGASKKKELPVEKAPTKPAAKKAAGKGAKKATATAPVFPPMSPCTEMLDSMTAKNTMTNAITNDFVPATPTVFSHSQAIATASTGERAVSFDVVAVKQEGGGEEEFPEGFRPPRKLSWSIDFQAIEAVLGSGDDEQYYKGVLTNEFGDGVACNDMPMPMPMCNDMGMQLQSHEHLSNMGMAPMTAMDPMAIDATVYAQAPYLQNPPQQQGQMVQGQMVGVQGQVGVQGVGQVLYAPCADQYALTPTVPQVMGMAYATPTPGAPVGMPMSMPMGGCAPGPMGAPLPLPLPDGSMPMEVPGLGLGTMGTITGDISMDLRVGAYTKFERRAKIEAFREKKRTRIWRKQIKYDCRKRLADTRPRVKGRFVSRKGGGGDDEGEDDGAMEEGQPMPAPGMTQGHQGQGHVLMAPHAQSYTPQVHQQQQLRPALPQVQMAQPMQQQQQVQQQVPYQQQQQQQQ